MADAETASGARRPGPHRPGSAARAKRCIGYVFASFALVALALGPLLLSLAYLHPLPAICAVTGAIVVVVLHPWLLPGGRGRRWRATLGMRPIDGPTIPWLAAAVLLFQGYQWVSPMLRARLTQALPPPHPPYAYAADPFGWLVVPLTVALLSPLAEELALRGYLQHKLGRVAGKAIALGVTSCVFGFLHGSIVLVPFFVFAGLVFGCALLAFRSIWAPVLMHLVANGLGQIPATAGVPPALERISEGSWPWILTVACGSGALLFLYAGYRARLAAGRRARETLAARSSARLRSQQPA